MVRNSDAEEADKLISKGWYGTFNLYSQRPLQRSMRVLLNTLTLIFDENNKSSTFSISLHYSVFFVQPAIHFYCYRYTLYFATCTPSSPSYQLSSHIIHPPTVSDGQFTCLFVSSSHCDGVEVIATSEIAMLFVLYPSIFLFSAAPMC